ncbi:hypothetical protein A2160_00950 [Candidatus Beckwithbacteria bacterium RBG_13_42_9]|uniref:DUF5652 domain-containing protein n=1 Tax=Candidatus Beckwithbacteria bacterium RBG_13_42_9 TaxID=1797457 RepID=A0A1F5E371_9BACT|nr:MAG: hypothetical protein A2160_00950 [Candidatus Beckwithbacteria bacterium RBG_13_42_9]
MALLPQDLSQLPAFLDSPWFIAALVWSMFWKGLALWHAAGRKQKIWFIILLVLNTFGILEIIYLVFVAKAIVEIKVIRDGGSQRGKDREQRK